MAEENGDSTPLNLLALGIYASLALTGLAGWLIVSRRRRYPGSVRTGYPA